MSGQIVEGRREEARNRRRPATPMIADGLCASWQDVPMAGWRWPNFSPHELSCRCPNDFGYCKGEYFHDDDFLDRLQALRIAVGKPIRITSARRCPLRNARVKGAAFSQHKISIALDISLAGHDPVALARAAADVGFKGIGFGRSFLHVDARVRPPGWVGRWSSREAFHYPGGAAAWTKLFGFDPAVCFDTKGHLNG